MISHKLIAGYVVVHEMFISAPSVKEPVESPAGHVNSPVSDGNKGSEGSRSYGFGV